MIRIISVRPSRFSTFNDLGLDTTALELGDKVAVMVGRPYGEDAARLAVVERLTPTQIVLEGLRGRYRREDGSLVGDRDARRIYPVDHPLVIAAQQRQIMGALKDRVLRQIGLGTERGVTAQDRIDAASEISAAAMEAELHIRDLERRAEAFEAAHAAVRDGR